MYFPVHYDHLGAFVERERDYDQKNKNMERGQPTYMYVYTTHPPIKIINLVWLFTADSQGSKKPPSGRPGQVDFPFGQVTFSAYLHHGQGPRQAVRRLNFW